MSCGRGKKLCKEGSNWNCGKTNGVTAILKWSTGAQPTLIVSYVLALQITLSGRFDLSQVMTFIICTCIGPPRSRTTISKA